jgi:hypothetical protein
MLRFLTDEDFNNNILRGIRLRAPDLEIVRVQDVGLYSADDPDVLAWAAETGRIVLTHDAETMPGYAYLRVDHGERMPGVFVARKRASMRQIIDDIIVLAECSYDAEWDNRVVFLPL